jgi:hypothetical protein
VLILTVLRAARVKRPSRNSPSGTDKPLKSGADVRSFVKCRPEKQLALWSDGDD